MYFWRLSENEKKGHVTKSCLEGKNECAKFGTFLLETGRGVHKTLN